MKICVNTQTPLVQFKASEEELMKKYSKLSDPVDLSLLSEGDDYQYTAGGVTRMVFPFLKQMRDQGVLEEAHWLSLNPFGPKRVDADGITLHRVSLKAQKMKGYGYAKEILWRFFHHTSEKDESATEFPWKDEFTDYVHYNRISAEEILRLDKKVDFDLFYVHDFQQLPIGYMLQTLKPKIFRWHIPFDESTIPLEWTAFISTYFNSYDTVIVSCKRYLNALKKLGFTGKAYHIYPHIDPSQYRRPTRSELTRFTNRFQISEGDKVVLLVARLDPMKGQDKAIEALSQVVKEIPKAKLILAGNGSFSSSKQGLDLSKAEIWRDHLRNLVNTLGIEDHVTFTGHISQEELNAAYERCDLTILPSLREGFGLVVIESWLFNKPVIASSEAGVSELIVDGQNGYLIDPTDSVATGQKIVTLISNPKLAKTLGEKGFETSKKCFIDQSSKKIRDILLNSI